MGYSLRDAHHRYIEWRELATGVISARELYDHRTDPEETVNRAAEPAHRPVIDALAAQLRAVAPAARR
jgi:iduronate 2-sulfatase